MISRIASRSLHTSARRAANTAGHDAHAASGYGHGHEEHAHKLFTPEHYKKSTGVGWVSFCLIGGCGLLAAAVSFQQKKGGFWFKKEQKN